MVIDHIINNSEAWFTDHHYINIERLDARAQRFQVRLAVRCLCRGRGEQQTKKRAEKQCPDQGLAFPCAETAARRRATSSASPR